MSETNTFAVILAAGASTRLGVPKQGLKYHGRSLLEHTITQSSAVTDRIFVVLGANHDQLIEEIDQKLIVVIRNTAWENGMSSSIRSAIASLKASDTPFSHILFLTCDQPLVTARFIKELQNAAFGSEKGVCAAGYKGTVGVPAIFSRHYVPELEQLSGDEGAKKIMYSHKDDLMVVPCEDAGIDIDTMEDYKNLNQGATD